MDEYYGQSSHCNSWRAGAISRAQMSLQQELRYIEACLPLLKPGRKCWKRAKVRWSGDGSGASAGRVSTV